jgi:quercetin dioxygenase-like cupin family protein
MMLRVHEPAGLVWHQVDALVSEEMRPWLDPGELASRLAFHERGEEGGPQLLEMELEPDAIIAPHSHDSCELYYLVSGDIRYGERILNAGGSIFIPGGDVYTFAAGPDGARLLNFRPVADSSFHPPTS